MAFQVELPADGHYWTAADILIQHIGKKEGGLDKLKGKKIALSTTTARSARSRSRCCPRAPRCTASSCKKIPSPRRAWSRSHLAAGVRSSGPTTCCCGLGRDEPTALKEAQATGYPRDKMYGVWWWCRADDVKDVGEGARATTRRPLNTGPGQQPQGRPGHPKHVHDKGQGTGPKGRVGQVLATPARRRSSRCMARRRRAPRAGALRQGQGHDRRAGALGLENLNLDQKQA